MRTELLFLFLSALSSFGDSRMFYLISDNLSWLEAQMRCRSEYIDLATADDQAEYEQLEKSLPKEPKTEAWIGLYKTSKAAPWIWSDQSSSAFRLWGSGQPNNYLGQQFCVGASLTGHWNDLECPDKCPSVCYTAKKKITARLVVKASQELNDLKIKTDILQQMQQILNEKGLPEDTKFSWKIQSDGNVFQKIQNSDGTTNL